MLETPNPESLVAGSINFHRDPTHLRPVHPDTLAFLCESAGFATVEILRLSPVPDDRAAAESRPRRRPSRAARRPHRRAPQRHHLRLAGLRRRRPALAAHADPVGGAALRRGHRRRRGDARARARHGAARPRAGTARSPPPARWTTSRGPTRSPAGVGDEDGVRGAPLPGGPARSGPARRACTPQSSSGRAGYADELEWLSPGRLVARACRSSWRTPTTTCACSRRTCSARPSGARRPRRSAAPCCPACTTSPTPTCAIVRDVVGAVRGLPLQRARRGAAGAPALPGARRRRGRHGLRPAGGPGRGLARGRRRASAPYLVYAGRLEEGKRVHVAVEHAVRMAAERPDAPAAGADRAGRYRPPAAARGRVLELGYVDEPTKRAVYAGALALVNPSEMESLSLVLMEAWLEGTPALVAAGIRGDGRPRAALGGRHRLRRLRGLPRRGRGPARRRRRARGRWARAAARTSSRSTAGRRSGSGSRPSPGAWRPDARPPAPRRGRARRRGHRPGPGLARRCCAAGAQTGSSSRSTCTRRWRVRPGAPTRSAAELRTGDALILHYSVVEPGRWTTPSPRPAPLAVCYHNVTPGHLLRPCEPGRWPTRATGGGRRCPGSRDGPWR